MVGVVKADGDEVADAGDRAAEARLAVDQRQALAIDRLELLELLRRDRLGRDVVDDLRKVAQLARPIDQAGLLAPDGAMAEGFMSDSLSVLSTLGILTMMM